MKKMGKKLSLALITVCVLVILTGCASMGKRAALGEYGQSLKSDSPYWDELTDASSKVNGSTDINTMRAVVQARIIPSLQVISNNAKTRNSTITDSEIKALDDHYVVCVDKLLEGFNYMLDGINTNDVNKIKAGNLSVTAANAELDAWVSGVDTFMKNNNIKDDGSIAAVKQMIH